MRVCATNMNWRRVVCGCVLAASATTLLGCKTVDFYERRLLTDAVMNLDPGPTEAHFMQKVLYSREGAAGGIGESAGGGCGCY